MNWQTMLLVGLLLGNNIATDIDYYENMYIEQYEQKQEKMYVEQVEKNPNDINALTDLANYYEGLWGENRDDFENFNKAEVVYKKIIEINPSSTVLADLYLKCRYKGQYYFYENDDIEKLCRKMEEEFLRLLEIDNDNVEVMIDLADLYSYLYYEVYHDSMGVDGFVNSDFFGSAEKLYVDGLNIDDDDDDDTITYKLIDLYQNEWKANKNSENVDNYEYFDKIEQQYLEILNKDKDDIQVRYSLISFYKECYKYGDIDCIDKIDEQYSEILKRASNEEEKRYILIEMGERYQDIWIESEYIDSRAFEKAEQSYRYALEIKPDYVSAQSHLTKLYETAYYFGSVNNEHYFEEAEKLYKEYSKNFELYYKENASFRLAKLYEAKWNEDKSDYKYYYMAENEFYNAFDVELGLEQGEYNAMSCESNLEVDYLYSVYEPIDVCVELVELYKDKYEFDGDIEALNNGKKLLVEQIPILYADEIAYVDGEDDENYIDTVRLESLGWVYGYVWRLDESDTQYYEKSEKTYLKLWDIEKDYYALFKLGNLYTERWLLDKSKVEYKEKALQCFDKIFAASDKLEEDFWFEEYIYPLLEEFEQ